MNRPVKLIVQVPCYNEEDTLPLVLRAIPKSIPGVDVIETQVVDDGCTDGTVRVGRECGVTHVVSYGGNRGLAEAFRQGMENAREQGADILVNTDGDNQYRSEDIPRLVEPILKGAADMVIGDRQVARNPHFSPVKKFLEWLGTRVTRCLAGAEVRDAVSGFRAYNRRAMFEINVISDFSYVLDTTVQAAAKKLRILHVPIETNSPTRPSRLFRTASQHVKRSGGELIRLYSLYQPFRTFLGLAAVFILIGLYPVIRFLYFFFAGERGGHVQSLIFGTIFFIIGFQFLGLGILGEHLRINRKLTEEILLKLKKRRPDA